MKLILNIDENGFLLFGNDKFINSNANVPKGFVDVPLPKDENGNQLSFYRPKWNGTEWIEGATQEEIDELTKVEPSPPTAEERINALEEALLLMMMEG